LLEQRPSADAEDLHRATIDDVDALAYRGIERREIEKGPMAQGSEDPALGDLDTHFDFGFVFGRPAARRNHHRAVVLCELGVGPIDFGLVAIRRGDAALQIVGHPNGGTAPERVEHPPMGIDPRGQLLRPCGLGVDQPARAEDADEEFDHDHLARRAVDKRGLLPREIDKKLFASEMHLAHRRFERPRPAAVAITKLAVAIPGRMRVAMLQPEQAERDAGAFQLQVDGAPVGQRARAGGDDA